MASIAATPRLLYRTDEIAAESFGRVWRLRIYHECSSACPRTLSSFSFGSSSRSVSYTTARGTSGGMEKKLPLVFGFMTSWNSSWTCANIGRWR